MHEYENDQQNEAREDQSDARLTLVGSVVTTAFTQAQLAAQIQASEAILADQEAQLANTRQRLALGGASRNDLLALQIQVAQTRAGIPPLRAETRAAEAGFDVAAANYRQTVLQALRNVADVLRALDHDAQSLAAQAAADAAARESLQLTRQQYALGAASHLQVLTAQQQMPRTRIDLIAAQARRLVDTAALYQAMGGGWSHDGAILAADHTSIPSTTGAIQAHPTIA